MVEAAAEIIVELVPAIVAGVTDLATTTKVDVVCSWIAVRHCLGRN